MPSAETIEISKAEVIEYIGPAIDILWAMHLDINNHPACPFRPAAEKGINGLTRLLDRVKGL